MKFSLLTVATTSASSSLVHSYHFTRYQSFHSQPSMLAFIFPIQCAILLSALVSQWVQLLSHVRLSVTPRTAEHQTSLSINNSWILLKLTSIKLVMPSSISSSVVPFSACLQSFLTSGSFLIRVLSIRWPKYWSFSFSISPSNEYSGLISFRMDWFDLLAV